MEPTPAATPPQKTDWPAFIRANTLVLTPPLVPEIVLHLAEESLPIWRKTEEELGQLNVPPPFWAFAWAGGQALARYLLDNPAELLGKRVLDLGAGSGLTAIAAMRCGAAYALASDIDEVAILACLCNAAANAVTIDVTSQDLLAEPLSGFDVILVGDLFYERALADNVFASVARARDAGTLVLVGDPQRSYFPRDRFVEIAQYSVPVTREIEDAEIKRTAVWKLA